MTIQDLPELLTVKEVAQILRVSDITVRRWARSGILTSTSIGDVDVKPHYRFSREAIYQMIKPAVQQQA
jgi:excisionase family DNA binding protein